MGVRRMKRTIKEAMKRINFLEQQIQNILQDEENNSYVIYYDNEEPEQTDYNITEVNKEIESLQFEVVTLRKAINLANQEVLIGIKDYTISDALIRIAQLTNNSHRLKSLASYKQKSRQTTYSNLTEYTLRLYDVKDVQKQYLACIEEIHALQTAIDKANILTEIEC